MFYEANKINEALICKHCEGRLDTPKTLPCGETICSFCEKSLQVNNDQIFDCLVCKDKHEMPKNGFKINKCSRFKRIIGYSFHYCLSDEP